MMRCAGDSRHGTPQQILAASAAAIGQVHGYELDGVTTRNHLADRFQLITSPSSSLELSASVGTSAYQVLRVTGAFYVRANLNFWRQKLGARAGILADRWIQVPASSMRASLSQVRHFAPATIGRCLLEDHGTLTVVGTSAINGEKAVLVRDAGNRPGTQPGVLAVATTGPPYPLQITATGPQRAGGRVDVCSNGKASDSRGIVSLSRFDQVQPLQAPTDAIRLGGAVTA